MRSRNSEKVRVRFVSGAYRAPVVGGSTSSRFAATPETTHVRRRFRNSFCCFPGIHFRRMALNAIVNRLVPKKKREKKKFHVYSSRRISTIQNNKALIKIKLR